MAKKKRTRRRRAARRVTRRRTTRKKRGGFPKLDVAESGQIAGALILAEVIRDRVDIAWLSEQAVAFLVLSFFSREVTKKRVYLSTAVGSQLKEMADMSGLTSQIKNLVPATSPQLSA